MPKPAASQMNCLGRDFTLARALSGNALCLTLLLAPDGSILDLNQHIADRLGQPLEKLKGTLLWPHLPSESRAIYQALVQRVLAERRPCRSDTEYAGRWYDSSVTPCLDGQGQAVGVAIVAWEITDRKRAEQESEKRFAALANAAPVLIWTSGTDKLCNYFNQVWLDFTGRTMEQEKGNGWTEDVHPDDRARCLEIYINSFDARQPFRTEYRLRRHDGQYRWLLDGAVPHYQVDGEFTGYIGSAIDITEAKQAEQALRKSEDRYRALVEVSPDAVFINRGNRVVFVNPAALRLFGASAPDRKSVV